MQRIDEVSENNQKVLKQEKVRISKRALTSVDNNTYSMQCIQVYVYVYLLAKSSLFLSKNVNLIK